MSLASERAAPNQRVGRESLSGDSQRPHEKT